MPASRLFTPPSPQTFLWGLRMLGRSSPQAGFQMKFLVPSLNLDPLPLDRRHIRILCIAI